jgi:hypothetical protein
VKASRWVTLASTLVVGSGCVQVLGLHERSEAADGGVGPSGTGADSVFVGAAQCGQLASTSASCASCMDQDCCAESKACAADPACVEASGCLAGCSDADCRARCSVFYSLPDTLIALRSCRVRRCSSPCDATCGEAASANAACQACLQTSCCDPATACASNVSCAGLQLCRSNCFVASSCPADCESKFPEGTTDFGKLLSCDDSCASACQPGLAWQCLDGPILWPKPKNVGNINFSVTFVDFSSERPFVGVTVKACSKLDFSCATPLATSSSDGTGLVALTVPAGLAGFDGYLDVSGGKIDGSGSAAYPALWYPVPFVVADGWRGRTQLLSADEFPALAEVTGTALDPTRGHFGANALDCAFGPASGVSFSADAADAKTQSYYLVGGVPVGSATSTDQSGLGGFINLPTNGPARLVVVRAVSSAAGGKTMGMLTFVVRPGTLTAMSTFPPLP